MGTSHSTHESEKNIQQIPSEIWFTTIWYLIIGYVIIGYVSTTPPKYFFSM
jgi:hypothetical protein